MSWPRNEPELERLFVIEFTDADDAVVRLLTPFVVQGCRVTGLNLGTSPEGRRLTAKATGLDPDRSEHLRLRLEALPIVRGVGLGWWTG